MVNINYQDSVTIVETSADGYANNRTVVGQYSVNCIFLQNTSILRVNSQKQIDADAVMYLDPFDPFVVEKKYRLENLYILAPLFEAADDIAWYKIIDVTINRDHLLNNNIDNLVLLLKKSIKIQGVS